MRITKLWVSGLKSIESAEYDLSPDVLVIVGENGAGKTALLQALELLAYGRVDGLPKTHEGVMRLARSDRIEVGCRIDRGDGRTATAKRWWQRDKEGKVSADIDLTGFPRGSGKASAKAGQLEGLLGSLTEAWRPDDLLELSAGKLRQRLLELVPGEYADPSEVVPENCPDWAAPEEGDQAIDWVAVAIARSRQRIAEEQRDRREQIATINEVDAGELTAKPLDDIQAELESLRAERDLARLRQTRMDELASLRASIDRRPAPETPWLADRLFAAIVKGAWDSVDAERRILKRRADELRRRADAIPVFGGEAPTREESTAAHSKVDEARKAQEDADAKRRDACVKANILRNECPILQCPKCQTQLVGAWDLEREAAESRVKTLSEEAEKARETARKASAIADDMDRRITSAQEESRRRSLVAEAAEMMSQIEALPMLDPHLPRKTLAADRLVGDRVKAADDLADLEFSLEIAQAKINECNGARDIEAVEESIQAAEASIETIGAANERFRIVQEARVQIDRIDGRIFDLKAHLDLFEQIQAEMLARVKSWLEERIGAALGAPVEVELFDKREKPTCRILVGGVDVSAISDGESQSFRVGLICALASGFKDQGWRPLRLDRFETVSQSNRKTFLEAVRDKVQDGTVDQALVAGCPDSVPNVEGVRVITV